MNLLEEFRAVVTILNDNAVPYAVCGGMAMAVYGHARATQDIDILVASTSIEDALTVLARLGYQEVSRLSVGQGQVRMIRTMKTSGTEHLTVDILEAPDAGEEAWTHRQLIETEFGPVWFASKAGLIDMKRHSGRLQDLADIERLEGGSS
ncbi:MAG: nucleotidyltransferase [Spirochaetia bacterium]|jgi:hypothetical protein|nr:nucleotidyltransferase [Spirochaetia bacterium]